MTGFILLNSWIKITRIHVQKGSIPDQNHSKQRNHDQIIISYIGDSPFGKTSFLRRLHLQNEGGLQANPIDTLISKK